MRRILSSLFGTSWFRLPLRRLHCSSEFKCLILHCSRGLNVANIISIQCCCFSREKKIYTGNWNTCFRQSHFKKVVLWARYIKHNLRFPLICAGWVVFKAKVIIMNGQPIQTGWKRINTIKKPAFKNWFLFWKKGTITQQTINQEESVKSIL